MARQAATISVGNGNFDPGSAKGALDQGREGFGSDGGDGLARSTVRPSHPRLFSTNELPLIQNDRGTVGADVRVLPPASEPPEIFTSRNLPLVVTLRSVQG